MIVMQPENITYKFNSYTSNPVDLQIGSSRCDYIM